MDSALISDRTAFILANTRLRPVPLVPEISLHIADEAVPLWQKTEEDLGKMGLPPPFWAFAWAGGQALARYILDHAEIVHGKDVLDFASGSGLVGIAAKMAGAQSVCAADIDSFASVAIGINAQVNAATLSVTTDDLLAAPDHGNWDVILAGDIFYERDTAERVFAFLSWHAERGATIFIGDPGRAYLPTAHLAKLAEYRVEVTRELEDNTIKRTSVWTFGGIDPQTNQAA